MSSALDLVVDSSGSLAYCMAGRERKGRRMCNVGSAKMGVVGG